MPKRYFAVVFLIALGGSFFIYPKITLAEEQIQFPETDTEFLLNEVQRKITENWYNYKLDLSPENQVALVMVRRAIRSEFFDYIGIQAPREVTIAILKVAVKLTLSPDVLETLGEIINSEIKKEIGKLAEELLFKNEIKVATGNLKYSEDSYRGIPQEAEFQYIVIYRPVDDNFGEAVIEIYSPNPIEPPLSKGNPWGFTAGTPWDLFQWLEQGKEKLDPFIVRVKGKVEKGKSGYYKWIEGPSIEVTFSEPVPHLQFEKPLSFWDKIREYFKGLVNKFKNLTEYFEKLFSAGPIISPGEFEAEELKQKVQELKEKMEATKEEYLKVKKEAEEAVSRGSGEDLEKLTEKLKELIQRANTINQELVELTDNPIRWIPEEGMGGKANEVGEAEEAEEAEEENLSYSLPPILISEVCAGLDKAQNEFIELYNPNDFSVSLSNENFRLKLVNSSDKITKKQISWERNEILARQYFLLVGGELIIDGQEIKADATYSSQLTGISGVIITDGEDNILDKVSWGKEDKLPPSSAIETQGKILTGGLKTGQSLARLKRGGGLIDNDNNSQDFVLNKNPSPTNSLGETKIYSPAPPEGSSSEGSFGGSEGSPPPLGGQENGQGEESGQGQEAGNPSSGSFLLVINEIMYDLEGSDEGREWIEIFNAGMTSVDLTGWKFYEADTNHNLRLVQGQTTIAPNDYAIITDKPEKFLADYPHYAKTLFDSSFSLSNTGEEIALKNGDLIIDRISYSADWGAGGDGNSLQRIDPAGDSNQSTNWQAATPTPGEPNDFSGSIPPVEEQPGESEQSEQPSDGSSSNPTISETIINTDTVFKAGEYNFENLTITNGAKLLLESDPSSPDEFKGVKINAQNLTIDFNSSILADGQGYSSEKGPGAGKTKEVGAIGDVYYYGGGAGYGGIGGVGSGAEAGFPYGDLLAPLELGSGGGKAGDLPGGAGGGAIIINISGTLTLNGTISVNGEEGKEFYHSYSGGGSGGSIFITVGTLKGSGLITANGGAGSSQGGGGAGGRIRIHYQELNSFSLANIQAYGGIGAKAGGAGTIYLRSSANEHGDLIIDNNNLEGHTKLENDFLFNNFKIKNKAILEAPTSIKINVLEISGQGSLINPSTSSPQTPLIIQANNIFLRDNSSMVGNFDIIAKNLTIDSNSLILADGKGYLFGKGPGAGRSYQKPTSGGSYGGEGGYNKNAIYGDSRHPTDFGSGGGVWGATAGSGGGVIKIDIEDIVILDGMISANGTGGGEAGGSGGSGGSVYITTNILNGSGIIIANGGDGLACSGAKVKAGGGGGGRIAVYYAENNFTGVIQADGGVGDAPGEPGTIFLKSTTPIKRKIF